MKPIRETLVFDPLFPLIFAYKQYRMKQNMEPPYHYHDWFEIVYVHSGKGTFFIDQSFYDMEAGNLFAIPGNIIHRARTNEETPYQVTVLLFNISLLNSSLADPDFSYLDCFEHNVKSGNYKINVQGEKKVLIETYLTKMGEESTAQMRGYRHQLLGVLHCLLTDLSRMSEKDQAHSQQPPKNTMWMEEILSYIELHFSEQLTLEHLAKQALVSQAHFSRVFKKMTGFHLPAYLNTKRVIKAKELLLKSEMPISFISEQCGFRSTTHFYRIFKGHFGDTPSHYRKGFMD